MNKNIESQVKKIIDDVRKNGDAAVSRYLWKLDGIKISPGRFRVRDERIKNASSQVDRKLAIALKSAAENIRRFHIEESRRSPGSWQCRKNGITMGQYVRPVEKAGLYVPGGRYCYPSTVLMTAIPARIAGVKEIILVTPPKNITPELLCASKIAGVDAIYQVGGPMAIAALAFGTRVIPGVDIIAGPGNAYVTEAKRQLYGVVGIDMLAGPSELAVLCDSGANPEYVALDLLAQVEHDTNSRGYLFCASPVLIKKVREFVPRPYRKQVVFFCRPLGLSIEMINKLAPEHLEIIHREAGRIIPGIKNAGAIFAGEYSPAVAGDYFAGPSHVLPTGGSARFSSGLSVRTFLKRTSLVKYSKQELFKNSASITAVADCEGLKFHSAAVKKRTNG